MSDSYSTHLNGNSKNGSNGHTNGIQERTVSESTYRKHVLRARCTDNHFTFDRDYVKKLKLSKIAALFLQDIINLANLRNVKRQIIDGHEYFLCTVGFLENADLDWSSAMQTRLFKELIGRGYVSVRKHGLPPVRWVFVDVLKIERDIDETDGKDDVSESVDAIKTIATSQSKRSTKNTSPTEKLNKKKRRLNGDAESRVPLFAGNVAEQTECIVRPRHREMARCLYQKVINDFSNRVVKSRLKPKQWPLEFALLEQEIGDADEIADYFDWQMANLGKEFVPETFSGQSFRMKYDNIKSIRHRFEQKSKRHSAENRISDDQVC